MELQRQVDWLGGEPARFDGKTVDPAIDGDRLGRQMNAVFAAMKNGGWWTLRGLANVSAGTEAGVSARIRDLRKRRFGGYTVLRRRVRAGLWEYRLVTKDTSLSNHADRVKPVDPPVQPFGVTGAGFDVSSSSLFNWIAVCVDSAGAISAAGGTGRLGHGAATGTLVVAQPGSKISASNGCSFQ